MTWGCWVVVRHPGAVPSGPLAGGYGGVSAVRRARPSLPATRYALPGAAGSRLHLACSGLGL
jgi:hypothetical protein